MYNPVLESQFYGDGQHNGGVYNWRNLNPFIYTYQNPVRYIDPNGKQTEGNQSWEAKQLSEIVTIRGHKYHKNTTNAWASFKNWVNSSLLGGDPDYWVEKKEYNSADDRFIHEAVNQSASVLVLGKVFGVASKLWGSSFNKVLSTATNKLVQKASEALEALGPGSGSVYGTKAHSIFAKAVDGLKVGEYTVKSEVSYLNGQIVPHGTKGSARIDAGLYNSEGELMHVFDLKTGGAKLTAKQVEHIQNQVGKPVGVSEIKVK